MKKQMNVVKNLLLVLVLISLVISCINEDSAWDKAKEKNSVAAYTKFIDKYPESKFIADAQQKIMNLEYSWKDGFLDKKYKEDKSKVAETLSKIMSGESSIIMGMQNIKNGTIITYATGGTVTFTKDGPKGLIISVKKIVENGEIIIGFKVNDGDKDASLLLHQTLQKNMK